MADCIFCKIIAGKIPAHRVYEDGDILAFLDITPINLGHTLVISKTHYENLYDLPVELFAKMAVAAQTIARAIKTAAKADGINIGMNNGNAAGQLVPHAHLHIIPRFADDGYESWHGKRDIPQEDFASMAEKIRASSKQPAGRQVSGKN